MDREPPVRPQRVARRLGAASSARATAAPNRERTGGSRSIPATATSFFGKPPALPSATMRAPLSPALAQLAAADPVLARLIEAGYAERLQPTAHDDLYLELLDAIIGQQLSVKAAATISARFTALFPNDYPTPERVLALSVDELRAVGVSRQKAGYLQAVAAFKQAGQLEYDVLSALSDDALADHLTQIKGVGRWTAQMLLMFALERPDVFPELDLGVQNAMRRHYGLTGTGRLLLARMTAIAEVWRPYRTTASRLLWKSLHNAPGEVPKPAQ